MKRITWTDTHYGRGSPVTGQYALDCVRAAYRQIGGDVRLYVDEDAAFVSADCKKGDKPIDEDGEEYPGLDQVGREIATNEAEAVRLWWNYYGYAASEDEDEPAIYCGGAGPDGIGGFTEPEDD